MGVCSSKKPEGPTVIDWSSLNNSNVQFKQEYTNKLVDQVTIIAEAELVDDASAVAAPSSAPSAKEDGGKGQPAIAEAMPMATAKGGVSADAVSPVIAEKPVVKLTVVIANEDGFKDLYNILTVPQPQFANIQELTLQPTETYKDALVMSVLDATTPGHASFGKISEGGPGIFADVIKACGPEACKIRRLVMSDFHMCPEEALKFADSLGNLKDLAYLEMVNAHLTDSTVMPIAKTLSTENPKMTRANFGENGIGAEVKTAMSNLFKTTHKDFILDAYG